jgi:polycomb protein EED
MRFGLFHELGARPILVMGNERSKIFFWDLEKLEHGVAALLKPEPEPKKRSHNKGASASRVRMREGSATESLTSEVTDVTSYTTLSVSASAVNASVSATARGKGKREKEGPTSVGDPFWPIQSHKSVVVGKVKFATRQVAWSRGGEWCVVVGDCGMVCLFGRGPGE